MLDSFKKNRFLIFLLLLVFSVCLAYSFYFEIEPAVDARAYDKIALNIVNGDGYRENLGVDILDDYAIARVGPLYEYFLAGIYYVFGHSYGVVWIIQALLHALTAWLIYLICRIIFFQKEHEKNISFLSLALFGFYPDLIEISSMIMTETLYLFLFALALYVFFRYFNKDSFWSVALLGLSFGLAILARPPVLFLLPVVLFYFYRKKKFAFALLFFIILVLVFSPWTVRNYLVYDQFIPFGVAGTFNFWIGNYHGSDGEQGLSKEAIDFVNTHRITEISGKALFEFKTFLIDRPLEFVKLTFLRVNKYFSIIRPMGFWFYDSGWSQFLFLFSSGIASIVLFVFGLAGTIRSIKLKNEQFYYLLFFTIITPLIIFITVVETRYRFQIYPLLAIFAGYFIAHMAFKEKWYLNKVFWVSFAFVFSNGILDLILSFGKFVERLNRFI